MCSLLYFSSPFYLCLNCIFDLSNSEAIIFETFHNKNVFLNVSLYFWDFCYIFLATMLFINAYDLYRASSLINFFPITCYSSLTPLMILTLNYILIDIHVATHAGFVFYLHLLNSPFFFFAVYVFLGALGTVAVANQ